MCAEKARPTVEEIYELLKRSDLPTVLVEGKDDVIFYRRVEDELREFDVDMLPAGNKDAVLELRRKIQANPITTPIIFIVDKDLWVYPECEYPQGIEDVLTTFGYSVENDLFVDGELESLLEPREKVVFREELQKFARWYALSIGRNLNGLPSCYRIHPNKILDDEEFYRAEMELQVGETYPEDLFRSIVADYAVFLRGKSLFALLLRQLSAHRRGVKFSAKQLMAVGASRKGANFEKMHLSVRNAIVSILGPAEIA